MTITLDHLDQQAASAFDGYLVRKDLVRKYARQYPVPTYVVEFLLGRYCASVDEKEIAEGLDDRTVRTGEEELFKARARDAGPVKLIDIVKARLAAKNDCFVAELPSLALREVRVEDQLVRDNERMLTDGFYAEVTLSYDGITAQEQGGRPFAIESLRPIQMSKADVLEVLAQSRRGFTTKDWIDFLIRSIGLEPAAFSERAKRVVVLRMVPFVERNYNLVELGPRGTGKSHLFQQISPYAHLISGGKATVAKMFVNNATGQRGLVCQYDVVCFDEVSGISFDQKDGVNIMKGYMASGQFSRGKDNIRADGCIAFYDEPLHIVRGEGVWLYDAAGRAYLDVYNNVPLVGHCQPDVVAALARQAATLNVHTRYLHETILDYGERLVGRLDSSLSMVIFVCTGSEANDQALRIARLHTGGEGVICTNLTYHGNTTAVDEVSPLFNGGVTQSPRVRAIPFPDSYRPLGGLAGEALADAYVAEVDRAIASFAEAGVGFAGMLLCPVFANEGLPDVPEGFMRKAVARVRAAGGLFIADEVQAGFGRTGRMWGHELAGVVPDMVTMGKPMGNGHPLAAVVARADLINEFRDRVMYFNSFGGNPVSCAVGNAVLDVLDRERLVDNAREVGAYVRAGLAQLEQRHTMIGDIRGHGLWIGVELVRDRVTKEPATEETHRAINLMKERGVLMGRIGQFDNVLKMRPPLPFSHANADFLLVTLDEVLGLL